MKGKRVVEVRELDDCLESTVVKEIRIDPPLDEGVMNAMGAGARLRFYPNFPKPYFRIERKRGYVIQGVIGKDSFRVTFSPSAGPEVEEELLGLIEGGLVESGEEEDGRART